MNRSKTPDPDEGPEVSLRKLAMRHKGVEAFVILNISGNPIKYHGMTYQEALHYGALVSELTIATTRFMKQPLPNAGLASTPENDVVNLRLRTKKHEIIVCPEGEFILAVVQNPKKQ